MWKSDPKILDAWCLVILTSVQKLCVLFSLHERWINSEQSSTEASGNHIACKVFCSSSSSVAVEDSRPLERLCLRLFHASIHTCAYLCDFLHLGGREQWGRLTAMNGSVCRVLGSLVPVWVCVNSGGLYGRAAPVGCFPESAADWGDWLADGGTIAMRVAWKSSRVRPRAFSAVENIAEVAGLEQSLIRG